LATGMWHAAVTTHKTCKKRGVREAAALQRRRDSRVIGQGHEAAR
jgi:hypothetical protein